MFFSVSGTSISDINSFSLDGNIFYVGGSGPVNYSTIQSAIDDASDRDTVFIYDDSSPYYENVQINKSINLIGEDRNSTIIDAKGKGNIILIKSENVSIKELTLQNSSGLNNASIKIDFYFGYCSISDNIIIDNDNGVSMYFSGENNIIRDNIFYNIDEIAIKGSHTHNNIIMGNTIDHSIGPNLPFGIFFFDFTGNNISGNKIKNCDSGINLGDDVEFNIIINNDIWGNKYDGISIREGSNNQILGNNISYNSRWGIEIQEGNDNYIYHNNLLYNYRNAVDGGKNIWDDGKYGNYWSDYKDNNPFGKRNLLKPWMWNIPYEIDGGDNKDNCPLINEWPSPKPRTITSDTSIFNPFWQGFIDMFPILVRILGLLS